MTGGDEGLGLGSSLSMLIIQEQHFFQPKTTDVKPNQSLGHLRIF